MKVVKCRPQLDVELSVLCPASYKKSSCLLSTSSDHRGHTLHLNSTYLMTELTFQPGTAHFLDFWMLPEIVIMVMGLEMAKITYVPEPCQPFV